MSRLRIYGDQSGYLDLVAPDSAKNNVINLEGLVAEDVNGNVGIGTTSATDTLHVVGDIRMGTETQEGIKLTTNENGSEIQLLNNTGAQKGLIDISDGNDDGEGVLRFLQLGTDGTEIGNSNATGTVKINTNSTSRLTVLANGFVGIGTDAPAYKLDVNGNLSVAGNFIVDGLTTTINSTTLNVDDVNITVANGAADAAAADGAGLTVDGAGATLTYVNAGDNWSFNKDLNLDGDLTVGGGQVTMPAVATRDKYRLWSNNLNTIGFDGNFTFGGLATGYAVTSQISNTAGWGFWWGDNGHTDAQGAMALTNDGKLTVAHSARVGYGETDTTTPGATHRLDVNGSIADDVSDVRTPRRIAISTTGQTISNEGVYYLTPPASSNIILGAPAAGTVMTLYNNTGNTISLEDGNTVTHLRLAADNNTTHNPALTLGAYSTTTITMFSGIHALVTGTDVS